MPLRLVSQEELPAPLLGYRLIERLGRGGFGEVWKVEAPGGLYKAAKFVFGDLQEPNEHHQPAEQELKALRRVREIRHPYILSLERFDTIEGQLIIVMELADRNLWDRFRECRARGLSGIPRGELLRYMEEAAEAIDLMNLQYQIQHLDIKPQNLFLVANHVKVGDFGLAKLLDGISASVTGGVTPVYAAPETFEGRVTRYCDQYSLAIVYQELLTGIRPFHGTNTKQLLMQHLTGTPDLSPLPEADRAVIARALSKNAEERWPSCTEMVQVLRGQAPGRVTAPISSAPPTTDAPVEAQTQPTPLPTDAVSHGTGNSALATRIASPGAIVPPRDGPRTHPTSPLLVTPSAPIGASTASSATPRLVTPSTLTHSSRLLRPPATGARPDTHQTPQPACRSAPPERTGTGVLVPAMLIGLGTTGHRVLNTLRQLLRQRFGDLLRLPHLRWLAIDTDVQAIETATSPTSPTAVQTPPPAAAPTVPSAGTSEETPLVLTRLHRPVHYLQHSHLPDPGRWLPPSCLARLGRQPTATHGLRALGRLALLDHHRVLLARLRQELEALSQEQLLEQAARHTNLSLRSTWPQVYLIADLGGGTGSGMFLDLAYWLRRELNRLGYSPRIHALLLLPAVEPQNARAMSVFWGNTYAALLELDYFQSGRGSYQSLIDNEQDTWTDSGPPFASVQLLVQSAGSSSRYHQVLTNDAARLLSLRLLSPLGRQIEQDLPRCEVVIRLSGLYHFELPRQAWHTHAAYRLARLLLQRWNTNDAHIYQQLREPVAAWLEQQLAEHRLTCEQLLTQFRYELTRHLGEDPDHHCEHLLQTLRNHTPSASKIDAATVCQVFDQILRLIGKPQAEPDFPTPTCEPILATAAERLTHDCDTTLAMLAVQLLEMPGYRFAGAEEAVRQMERHWTTQILTWEQMHEELQRQVRSFYQRLLQLIAQLEQGGSILFGLRRSAVVQEILETLRVYYQRQIHQHFISHLLTLLRHLREGTSEFLHDLALCRQALRQLDEQLARHCPAAKIGIGTGRLLLPNESPDLASAVDRFLEELTQQHGDALDAWEQRLQQGLQRKFRGLGNVCLKVSSKGADFCAWLLDQCRAFLDPYVPRHDPAETFWHIYGEGDRAANVLHEAVEEAAPALTTPLPSSESCGAAIILPPSSAGQRLGQFLVELRPELNWQQLTATDELCLYRDYTLPLHALPHLGSLARQAYQQLLASDHPPHTRMDIPWSPSNAVPSVD
jgi:serine/threonine protein kinase